MLDTSRRFFKVDTIKKVIDALALAKFNVFHWHLLDDDSFPLELEAYPNVTKNGAFSAEQTYSKADVLDIVNYAANLAIRVIPEFDNPGHARSVGFDASLHDAIRCFNKDWPW